MGTNLWQAINQISKVAERAVGVIESEIPFPRFLQVFLELIVIFCLLFLAFRIIGEAFCRSDYLD